MNQTNWKQKFRSFALPIPLMLTLGLIGCANVSPPELYYSPTSQPDYLYLKSGVAIQTKQGLYKPPTEQKWVSEAKLLTLERQNLDLVTAIKQQNAKNNLK